MASESETMRAEFECWCVNDLGLRPDDMGRMTDGVYRYRTVEIRWRAWQAAWSRAPSAEAKNTWQPIKTAPKDGGEFICSRRSGKRGLNHWTHEFHSWSHVVFNDPMTHWMPLPAPPAIAQQGAAAAQEVGRG